MDDLDIPGALTLLAMMVFIGCGMIAYAILDAAGNVWTACGLSGFVAFLAYRLLREDKSDGK